MPKGKQMAQPLKKGGLSRQLTLLLPITTVARGRTKTEIIDKVKIEESRKRLLKDLEGTGLRSPK